MTVLVHLLWPELILAIAACVLFLLGAAPSAGARKLAPWIALIALAIVFCASLFTSAGNPDPADHRWIDPTGGVLVGSLAAYIKLLASGVGCLFVFLSWPTDAAGGSNSALDVGTETGEFFALLLLSIAGVFLVAGANDIMLLFLGIELASIPTYVMVSISRPLPIAQEAGVKYFFLGAMSAAVMLFGFSYLYGATGTTSLAAMRDSMHPGLHGDRGESIWQLLAIVMVLMGLAFKIAAVPLHAYAGDVYQGAATPVTALLAFVPKTSGMVAFIKILSITLGPAGHAPDAIIDLLWVIAVLSMSFGNVLALLQLNVKRVLAYSSVAHSGYMLVGLTAWLAAGELPNGAAVQNQALAGVLFYLCAYGIMNTGAFGVLMQLRGRTDGHGRHGADGEPLPTAGSAETFEDLAGQGRRYLPLGLAMVVCCFSLTGLPLTVGFFGKVLLIKPALAIASHPNAYSSMMVWLVVITMVNAAISAGYYLKIIAYMFLRADASESAAAAGLAPQYFPAFRSTPVRLAIILSVVGTLYYGIFLPGTRDLTDRVESAAVPMPSTAGGNVAHSPQGLSPVARASSR
ncbi:MAG TPA: NADH-quinone oxidoreductase subunit N [Tepidisphaeraceae bacterium]|nr:NADH-quinone oxidoreductase subunit N [Tepidisphaeraceae bacterium]